MMRFSVLIPTLLASSVLAQAVAPDDLLNAKPDPIPDGAPAAMAHIDRGGLAKHAFHFASDQLGGRHTGTAGQMAAAQYIAEHFRSLGLKPLGDESEAEDGERSYLQHYPVRRTFLEREFTGVEFGQYKFPDGFAVMPGRRGKTEIDVDGKLVFVGRGRRKDMPSAFGENDIPVAILQSKPRRTGNVPPEVQFMMGFREIGRASGIAKRVANKDGKFIMLLDLGNRLADVMQYGGVLPGKPILAFGNEMGMGAMFGASAANVPMMIVGPEMSQKVLERLNLTIDEDGAVAQTEPPEDVSAKVRFKVSREAQFNCTNTVAVLEGSDPQLRDEAVVFSAHMDHMGTRVDGDVFNGADDNASGSSALLEIAEAFAKGDKPKRSVIFLAVSGEELGLWGSAYFSNNPTWPLEKLVANVNIDMIGRATELSGEDEISITPSYRHRMFSTIARDSAKLAESFGLGLTVGDKFYERSDHYNFAEKGIPVVFYCDGEHEDYHQVTDTADKLDYRKMERVSRLAYWTGWKVCQAAEQPKRLGRRGDWTGAEKN